MLNIELLVQSHSLEYENEYTFTTVLYTVYTYDFKSISSCVLLKFLLLVFSILNLYFYYTIKPTRYHNIITT